MREGLMIFLDNLSQVFIIFINFFYVGVYE